MLPSIFSLEQDVKLNRPGEAILKNGLQYEMFKVSMVDDIEIQKLINDRVMSSINGNEELEEKECDHNFKTKIDCTKIIKNIIQFIKSFTLSFVKEVI